MLSLRRCGPMALQGRRGLSGSLAAGRGGDGPSGAQARPGTLPAEAQNLTDTRAFTAADVAAFAKLTGDDNPLHADADFASSGRYGGRVVHGMLYASMFGAIVGVRFPGAVYLSQTLEFKKPVFLGESVTATLVLRRAGAGGRVLDFETVASKVDASSGTAEVVLRGEARVLLPRDARLRVPVAAPGEPAGAGG